MTSCSSAISLRAASFSVSTSAMVLSFSASARDSSSLISRDFCSACASAFCKASSADSFSRRYRSMSLFAFLRDSFMATALFCKPSRSFFNDSVLLFSTLSSAPAFCILLSSARAFAASVRASDFASFNCLWRALRSSVTVLSLEGSMSLDTLAVNSLTRADASLARCSHMFKSARARSVSFCEDLRATRNCSTSSFMRASMSASCLRRFSISSGSARGADSASASCARSVSISARASFNAPFAAESSSMSFSRSLLTSSNFSVWAASLARRFSISSLTLSVTVSSVVVTTLVTGGA